MPLTISVVIPFHRAEFFHEAMSSVLDQTCLPDEIVVVNDGASTEDAEQLGVYEKTARIIHQPNRGPGAARNAGVAASSSEWIAFLDDDDVWEPDRLKILRTYIEAHPGCNAVHNAVRVLGTERISRNSELTLRHFLTVYPSPAKSSSVMVRRTVLLQSGLMNPTLSPSEDYECFLRVSITHRFHYVDVPLTHRRKHGRSLSRQFESRYRVRNRILCLYQDLYENEDDRIHFAARFNSRFLALAWERRDLRAGLEIIRLARLHGVSIFRLMRQTFGILKLRRD